MYSSYTSSSVAHSSFAKLDVVQRSPNTGQHALPDLLPTGSDLLRHASTNTEEKAISPVYVCDMPIPEMFFSAKTYNALFRGRIKTIKQLCALELADFKWLRGFGKKAEQEVAAYRACLGAPLKTGA